MMLFTSILKLIALVLTWPLARGFTTSLPIWLTSPLFRAGSQAVITNFTGSGTNPQYMFTFSSPLTGVPNLAYGIKRYRGNDLMMEEFFQIRKVALTSSTFTVEVQIYGVTNLWILNVAYLAVEPSFPYHLNSFDNVPVNFSSGNVVNISNKQDFSTSFTEVIDYRVQAAGKTFDTFTQPLSANRIVLFITSLWVKGTKDEIMTIQITPTVLNTTHYQWTTTTYKRVKITRYQFSQIIFNEDDVESSGVYYIVYEEWVNDMNGGFRQIPVEFADNFIMGVTDFEATNASCGFEYQWEYSTSANGTDGVEVLLSQTLKGACGFSLSRSSILYLMTWDCPTSHPYFNITLDLCQDQCGNAFSSNTSNGLHLCDLLPCQTVCTNCQITPLSPTANLSSCLACNATLDFVLSNGSCVCDSGFSFDGNYCTEICGDGILKHHACDDGNTASGDGCSQSCTVENYFNCQNGTISTPSVCFEVCGDSHVVLNQQCDDGNLADGDGCSSVCTVETGFTCDNSTVPSSCVEVCGDGIVIYDACDDGNTNSGDGCSSSCAIENYFDCQNGTNSTVSVCFEVCGDSHVVVSQQCDDGNLIDGDGCSSVCTVETGYSCNNSSVPTVCSQACGDGILINATCDDGNTINGDGCSSSCTVEAYWNCSNGSITTSSVCVSICGDSHTVGSEQCDDGNLSNGDGCSSLCTVEAGYSCDNSSTPSLCGEACGDGTLIADACDDGNTLDGDGCSSNCTIQTYWNCFNGTNISSSVCLQTCGDNHTVVHQQCDDGNLINGDGCSSVCTVETGYTCINSSVPSVCSQFCGDGIVLFDACDDGNTADRDGCSSNCTIEDYFSCDNGTNSTISVCFQVCGDNHTVVSQQCDDGNLIDGDGCSSTCTVQIGYICINSWVPSVCSQVCGDGIIFADACDDGNTVDGDGCSSNCTIEDYFSCENGTNSTASVCFEVCGDNHTVVNQQCDDGNLIDGDGCSSACTVETGFTCINSSVPTECSQVCGDGILFYDACDDGNTADGDGCSSNCTVEAYWNCTNGTRNSISICLETCGDNHTVVDQQCDDGNLINGDGCSSVCTVQVGYTCVNSSVPSFCNQICGDSLVFTNPCDDGNTVDGDGCSSNCTIEAYWNCSGGTNNSASLCTQICGDSYVVLEDCDDGNLVDLDGCSSNCTFQDGFSCDNSTIPTNCTEVCGDGILFNDACDDNNTVSGDGCSSDCQVESGYTCLNGTNTTKSDCIVSAVPVITVTQYWKDPNQNAGVIKLQIADLMDSVASNIYDHLDLGFPYSSLQILVDSATGEVILSFTYNQSLNSADALTLEFTTAGNISVIELPSHTDNNLAFKYYDSNTYATRRALNSIVQVISYMTMAVFMIGMGASRLVPIEMVFIFQFTHCALVTLQKLQTLMEPLKYLYITQGPNVFLTNSSSSLPPRLSTLCFTDSFLGNLNLHLLCLCAPALVGGILRLMGWFFGSQKLAKWGNIALNEWLFSGSLFIIFQFIFSFVISLKYEISLAYPLVLGCSLILLFFAQSFLLKYFPQFFGQYKTFFKLQQLSYNFYLFILVIRLLMALTLILFYDFFACSGLVLGMLLVWGLAIVVILPYTENFRPICNSAMVISIASILTYCQSETHSTQNNAASYLPIAIIVILIVNLLFNSYYIITGFFDLCMKQQGTSSQELPSHEVTIQDVVNTFQSQLDQSTIVDSSVNSLPVSKATPKDGKKDTQPLIVDFDDADFGWDMLNDNRRQRKLFSEHKRRERKFQQSKNQTRPEESS